MSDFSGSVIRCFRFFLGLKLIQLGSMKTAVMAVEIRHLETIGHDDNRW